MNCHVCGQEVHGPVCTACGTPALGEAGPNAAAYQPYAAPGQPYAAPGQPYVAPGQPYVAPGYPQAPSATLPPGYGGQPYAPAPGAYPQQLPTPAVPGYPSYAAPRPSRRSSAWPVAAGVLGLALVGLGFLAVQKMAGETVPTRTPVTSTVTVPGNAPVVAPTNAATPATASTAASTAPTNDAESLDWLASTAASQRGTIPFNGTTWVAQLASKSVGATDDLQTAASGGHTFGAHDIYAEHQALKARVRDAQVFLADSRTYGDHKSVNGQPLWRTLATSPAFTSKDAVTAWCARTFPELNQAQRDNQCVGVRA